MEERVFQEISDLINEIPIPFTEFNENIVVTSLKNVKMGLRLDGSSEERF